MASRFRGWSDEKPGEPSGDQGSASAAIEGSGVAGVETGSGGNEDRETIEIVDPASASAGTGGDGNGNSDTRSTGPKRARGRPRGSRAKAKTVSDTLVGVREALIGLHYTLAQFTRSPELQLDGDEAQAITECLHKVAAEYSYEDLPQITKQTFAWANLAVVLIGVYSGRIYDIAQRKKRPAPTAAPPGGGEVVESVRFR